MNKTGKAIPNGVVYVMVIAVIGLLALGSYAIFWMPKQQAAIGGGNVLTPSEQQEALLSCGSTKQTTVTMTVKNDLNTTASQTYDNNYALYLIGATGETQVATGSDTTAGTQTLDCGSKYRLKLLADDTHNSRIKSVYTQNAVVDTDGSVTFTTTAPSLTLGMVSTPHSTLEVRAYNEEARARMYAGDGSNSAYENTGAVFWSTTANGTATSVTAGSSLLQTLEMRAVSTVGDFNDYGVYVLFDADPSYWDNVQRVSYDGTDLVDVKTQLNGDESKAFSAYEYVFFIPSGKLVDSKNHRLYFDVLKSSGASGANTLKVDFAAKGNYLSVDGFTIKTAGAKDTASSPTVFTKFQTSFMATD